MRSMASRIDPVMVDFDDLAAVFTDRNGGIAAELDDEHWEQLFGEDEDDEVGPEQLRAAVAALVERTRVPSDVVWEDAFYGLCDHFGETLGGEFFDRINDEFIAEVDELLAEQADVDDDVLTAIIYDSTVPLDLPAATDPSIILGFISRERVDELHTALYGLFLDSGDRDILGAAVQFRNWIHLAYVTDRALILFHK